MTEANRSFADSTLLQMASVEKHVTKIIHKFAQTSKSLIKLHRIAPLYLGVSMSEKQRELRKSPYRGSQLASPYKKQPHRMNRKDLTLVRRGKLHRT
jgi:hypothetical protein